MALLCRPIRRAQGQADAQRPYVSPQSFAQRAQAADESSGHAASHCVRALAQDVTHVFGAPASTAHLEANATPASSHVVSAAAHAVTEPASLALHASRQSREESVGCWKPPSTESHADHRGIASSRPPQARSAVHAVVLHVSALHAEQVRPPHAPKLFRQRPSRSQQPLHVAGPHRGGSHEGSMGSQSSSVSERSRQPVTPSLGVCPHHAGAQSFSHSALVRTSPGGRVVKTCTRSPQGAHLAGGYDVAQTQPVNTRTQRKGRARDMGWTHSRPQLDPRERSYTLGRYPSFMGHTLRTLLVLVWAASCSRVSDPTQVEAGLTREQVYSVLESARRQAFPCFETEPDCSFIADFRIGPEGNTHDVKVRRIGGDAVPENVESCLSSVVSRWHFPPARVDTRVSHPWECKKSPPGDDEEL